MKTVRKFKTVNAMLRSLHGKNADAIIDEMHAQLLAENLKLVGALQDSQRVIANDLVVIELKTKRGSDSALYCGASERYKANASLLKSLGYTP